MDPLQKVKYFKMALALVGVEVNEPSADLIMRIHDRLKKKKGSFTIQDAAEIEVAVRGHYQEKEVHAVPDPIVEPLTEKQAKYLEDACGS